LNRLVLWDIDRTLVTVAGVSQQIYRDAFRSVTGRDLQTFPDMAGKTDHDLVTTTLAIHDIPSTPELVDRFYLRLISPHN
jgi:hypothetical protein